MKIIELNYAALEQLNNEPIVLVLGFFDGVHLGHQSVIKEAKHYAEQKKQKLAVLSFNQHPSVVFLKECTTNYLTTLEQKAKLFENLGVDMFYVVPFTSSFAELTPLQFIQNYLLKLNASTIVAGFDYRFGQNAQGDMTYLSTTLAEKNIDVITVNPQQFANEKISSTAIRRLLAKGEIEKANQLLGRIYTTSGIVHHGDARGRQLGFPTANVVGEHQLLPAEAIYAVKIKVANQWYEAMASIGRNITFESNRPVTVEVNIFNFDKMIYGETVEVAWYKKLRQEIKFDNIDQLVEQLNQDKQMTQAYFSK